MLLPEDRPLLAATLRALPAGILLMVLSRRLPRGEWWWKSWVLGILNIGAFIAGCTGLLGVTLIVLQAQSRLDAIGLAAAIGGTFSMASGIVLSKKWGQPAPALTTTAWQLISGELSLLVLMLVIEGLPVDPFTVPNVLGYTYLSVIGTAFAYVLWFRGIVSLTANTTAFLGLLSPVVAILLGWIIAGENLSPLQTVGIVIVLASISAAVITRPPQAARMATGRAASRSR